MAATPEMAPSRPRRSSSAGNTRASNARGKDASLEEQIARLQEDIRQIAGSVAGIAEQKLSEAQGLAKREARQFVRGGQHAVEDVTDEFGHLEKQLKAAIREKPLTAVAGAIALGFLIAMITR